MTDNTQQARASSLDQIRARLEAATPGPWVDRVDDLTDEVDVVHDQEHVSFVASCGDKSQPRAEADAEFIANAPTDIARLMAAVDVALSMSSKANTILAKTIYAAVTSALEGGEDGARG